MKRTALLIGVSEYVYPWGNLTCCKNDVESLSTTLNSSLGSYCFDQVSVITGADATYDHVLNEIDRVFGDPGISEDHLILFYFSGHGFLYKRSNGIEKGILVLNDTKKEAPFSNCLDIEQLRSDYFDRCNANVLFIIDSCHSGTLTNYTDSPFAKAASMLLSGKKALLASSAANDESFIYREINLSKFTFHLINGLANDPAALSPNKITVTFESLVSYLDVKLKQEGQNIQRVYALGSSLPLSSPKIEPQRSKGGQVDFTIYLDTNISRYEEVPPGSNDSYIHLSGRTMSHKHIAEIDEFIENWVEGQNTLLTIFGDTGTGKSTIAKRVVYNLSKKALSNKTELIPLFIELKEYNKIQDLKSLIINKLQNEYTIKIFWDQVLDLMGSGKLVIILDGFDEMSLSVSNVTIENNFRTIERHLYSEHSKIILTCRRQYLNEDNDIVSLIVNSRFNSSGYEVVFLNFFKPHDIHQFITKNIHDRKTRDFCFEYLEESQSTKNISSRPILLEVLVKSVPSILERGEKFSHEKIFRDYIRGWITRDKWRFADFIYNFKDDLKNIFHLMTGEGPREDDDYLSEFIITTFIKELAWHLYESKTPHVSFKKLPSIIREQLPAIKNKVILDFFDYSLRTCSFLTRDEHGQYSFIHEIFLFYFLSDLFKSEIINNRVKYFGRIKLEESVVSFLSKMVMAETAILKKWILEKDKIEKGKYILHYLGGNAATLLNVINGNNFKKSNFGNAHFKGANLKKADFEEANITNSIFSDVNLKEAKLSNARMRGTILSDVNFDNCNLSNLDINGGTEIYRPLNLDSVIGLPPNFNDIVIRTNSKGGKEQTDDEFAEMIRIPAGVFVMGSNTKKAHESEKPIHHVYLDEYYIDKYPVTNEQFHEFIKAMPEWDKMEVIRRFENVYYLMHWKDEGPDTSILKHPVVYVSWYAAKAYAEWAGKRLPAEAEWEKAVRGPNAHAVSYEYPWGEDESDMPEKTNYSNKYGGVKEIGAFPETPNRYGLYDMFGNVKEWCSDWFADDYYKECTGAKPVHNPQGPEFGEHKVLRGGSYISGVGELRCAHRSHLLPVNTNIDGGFRCVKRKNNAK